MRINVTKKSLSEGLSLLERVIPARSSNPTLTSLKAECRPDGLLLSGTNLEIDMEVFVPGEVQDGAPFTVPAHLFAQVVRNMGGELVELKLSDAKLRVKSGGSKFDLQTGDVMAYPPLSFPEDKGQMVGAEHLSRAFGNVRYAVSNEAYQAVFRGAKVEQRDGVARVVASDGYRVAVQDFPADHAPHGIIIPGRSIDEMIRVLKGVDGDVGITHHDGQLTLTTDRVRMNVKLLDGDFPDYERVIPKEIKLQITLPAAQLQDSVNRVAVLADKNANNRIEFLISEGQLTLSAEGDYGEARDTLSVTQGGTEQAMSLAFNARHVLDALKAITGDVELLFSGSTSPAIIRPLSGDGYMAVMVTLRA